MLASAGVVSLPVGGQEPPRCGPLHVPIHALHSSSPADSQNGDPDDDLGSPSEAIPPKVQATGAPPVYQPPLPLKKTDSSSPASVLPPDGAVTAMVGEDSGPMWKGAGPDSLAPPHESAIAEQAVITENGPLTHGTEPQQGSGLFEQDRGSQDLHSSSLSGDSTHVLAQAYQSLHVSEREPHVIDQQATGQEGADPFSPGAQQELRVSRRAPGGGGSTGYPSGQGAPSASGGLLPGGHRVEPGARGGEKEQGQGQGQVQGQRQRGMDEAAESEERHSGAGSPGPSAAPVIGRRDLLEIVRKHTYNLLSKDGPHEVMDPAYWRQLLDLYFVRGAQEQGGAQELDGAGVQGDGMDVDRAQNSEQQEEQQHRQHRPEGLCQDMLFFVWSGGSTSEPTSPWGSSSVGMGMGVGPDAGDGAPVRERRKLCFARQWASDLEDVVGDRLAEVDWRQSFYLNLICHTQFSLTLAVCSRQALENHRKSPTGTAPVPPIAKVTRRVIASPTWAPVDPEGEPAGMGLGEADEGSAQSGYPNISFALEPHDSSILPAVLESQDHCLCVLLNAHGGAPFPAQECAEERSRNDRESAAAPPRGRDGPVSPRGKGDADASKGFPSVMPHGGRGSPPLKPRPYGQRPLPVPSLSRSPSSSSSSRGGGRSSSSEAVALGEAPSRAGGGTPKITLFSGFVSYAMLRHALRGQPPQQPSSGGGSMGLWGTPVADLSPLASAPVETLVMRGPGGRGQATVSVTPVIKRPPPPLPPKPPTAPRFKAPRPRPLPLPSLEAMQRQLVAVQEELLSLVQQQADMAMQEGQPQGASGASGASGPGASGATTRAATAEEYQARDRRNRARLMELQEELLHVQEQLQQLKKGRGGASDAGSPSPRSSRQPGVPQAKDASDNQQNVQSGVQGGGGGLLEFRKRSAKTPPRRTAITDEAQRLADATAAENSDMPLKCSLTSLSLPWENLAFDLLFKGMPIKISIGGQVFPPPATREAPAERKPPPRTAWKV